MHFTDSRFKKMRALVYTARLFGAIAVGFMVVPVFFLREVNWWVAFGVLVALCFMLITERSLTADYRWAAHVRRVAGLFWTLLHDDGDALGSYDVPRNTTLRSFDVDFVDGYYALTLLFKDGGRHEYAVYMDGVTDITDGSVTVRDLNLLENSVAAFIADVHNLNIQSSARFPDHVST